jgi:hypothetical protein
MGYPIETLERQWGVNRREDQKEPKFFNRRRSTITIINNVAAYVVKERRSRLNKPLHYLAEHNHKSVYSFWSFYVTCCTINKLHFVSGLKLGALGNLHSLYISNPDWP